MDERSKGCEWSMSNEREFMENLLCQRFNFFIAFFAAVIAGLLTTTSRFGLLLILWVGFIIAILLAFAVARAQQKLDLILKELFKDERHPARIIDSLARGVSVRPIIGYLLPFACSLLLLVLAMLATCGCLPTQRAA